MDVVTVPSKVIIIANDMFPKATLPQILFLSLLAGCRYDRI